MRSGPTMTVAKLQNINSFPKETSSPARVPSVSPVDAVAQAWKALLLALGYEEGEQHLMGSPDRIARFLRAWHSNGADPPQVTTFENAERYEEIVVVDGISFYSLCAHHGLPFFGTAAVGYLPGKKIAGLSKLARVVDHFAHRFQTQERLTKQIADYLYKELEPRGTGVVLRAEHLCMAMRGVRKPGHVTTTSDMRGIFLKDFAARSELLGFLKPSVRIA